MKKVLFIITDYGSFNNFLGELAVVLSSRKFEVHILCSKDKVISYDDKFRYSDFNIKFHFVSFPRNMFFFHQLRASWKIRREIKRISPDFVSIHFTTGIFTTLLFGKLGIRTIGTFHGLGYPVINKRITKLIFYLVESYCFLKLDQIWLLNQFDYELVRKRFPRKAHMLPTRGLGCDINKFNILEYKSGNHELKYKLDITPSDFVLAYTGRFVNFKGFHYVIRAFRELLEKNRFNNVKLLLIGGRDSIHSTGLTIQEEQWFMENRNVVDVGFTSKVGKYLSISDVFVFPSKKEGMPVCIMEALAMGLPVITTDSRGCADLVKDSINGLILPNGFSYVELANVIIRLIKDRTLLEKLKTNVLLERDKLDRRHFINHQIEFLSAF